MLLLHNTLYMFKMDVDLIFDTTGRIYIKPGFKTGC